MEIQEILADNVARRMANLNVAELAMAAEISERVIYKYANQEAAARIDKLSQLATAMGLSVWMLLLPGLPEDLDIEEFSRYVNNYLRLTPRKRSYLTEVSDDTVTAAVRASDSNS